MRSELVEVDYEELAPVASSADALDPASTPIFADAGSNVLVDSRRNSYGDVDGGVRVSGPIASR